MWKTRGLRGSTLENLINMTNEYYKKHGVARIDKAATPVKVTEISANGKITEGYFEKKSTVDFYGVAQGHFLAFDAKQTSEKSFPLKNVHSHQLEYMKDASSHGAVVFFIVEFTKLREYYLLPYEIIRDYYINSEKGGRKSIPIADFPQDLKIEQKGGSLLKYLEAVNVYFDWKKSYYENI